MESIQFEALNVVPGDQIELHDTSGRNSYGEYQGEYDGNSFLFQNFSNGKQETIFLNNLHLVLKMT